MHTGVVQNKSIACQADPFLYDGKKNFHDRFSCSKATFYEKNGNQCAWQPVSNMLTYMRAKLALCKRGFTFIRPSRSEYGPESFWISLSGGISGIIMHKVQLNTRSRAQRPSQKQRKSIIITQVCYVYSYRFKFLIKAFRNFSHNQFKLILGIIKICPFTRLVGNTATIYNALFVLRGTRRACEKMAQTLDNPLLLLYIFFRVKKWLKI
jgi:hypothetical protein